MSNNVAIAGGLIGLGDEGLADLLRQLNPDASLQ